MRGLAIAVVTHASLARGEPASEDPIALLAVRRGQANSSPAATSFTRAEARGRTRARGVAGDRAQPRRLRRAARQNRERVGVVPQGERRRRSPRRCARCVRPRACREARTEPGARDAAALADLGPRDPARRQADRARRPRRAAADRSWRAHDRGDRTGAHRVVARIAITASMAIALLPCHHRRRRSSPLATRTFTSRSRSVPAVSSRSVHRSRSGSTRSIATTPPSPATATRSSHAIRRATTRSMRRASAAISRPSRVGSASPRSRARRSCT